MSSNEPQAESPEPNGSVLCHLGVHRGLGHLSRQATILRTLQARRPSTTITFHLSRPDEHVLAPGEFPVLVGDAEAPDALLGAVRACRPDVLLFDTFLPAVRPRAEEFPNGEPPAVALTLRKVFPERLRPILANPWMDWVQLILVPHEREEFAPRIEERRHTRLVYTGAVVRPSSHARQAAALARCGLVPGEPFLLATTGGGGIPAYFERFSTCVFRGLELARRALPPGLRLPRCVFVTGPLNSAPEPVPEGVTCIAFEPDLTELIAAARLVVSHTGYNTSQEILASGTPAVFLPMITKYDDGLARARRCASLGIARVVEELDPERLGSFLTAYLSRPEIEGGMRRAFSRIPPAHGAERAAAALATLIEERRGQLCDVVRPLGGHVSVSPLDPSARVSAARKVEGRVDARDDRAFGGPGVAPRGAAFSLPVLTYRTVGEGVDAPGAVTFDAFRAQLDWICTYARPLSLTAALDRLEDGAAPEPGSLVLTFDEAYAKTFHLVAPLLRDRGIRAVFFLPTRHLGHWDEWNTRSARVRAHLGWDDVAAALAAGHSCGVHGRSHHALSKFDREELKKELLGAVRDVEDRLGTTPRFVAYPHGAVSLLVLKIAKKAFSLGFVGADGESDWRANGLAIRRIPVMPDWRLPEFARAVHQCYPQHDPAAF